jgi:hypothetical protein
MRAYNVGLHAYMDYQKTKLRLDACKHVVCTSVAPMAYMCDASTCTHTITHPGQVTVIVWVTRRTLFSDSLFFSYAHKISCRQFNEADHRGNACKRYPTNAWEKRSVRIAK